MLSKDAILRAQDIGRELVEVPEWGGSVYVRGFTASEKAEFEMRGMEIVDVTTGMLKDPRQMTGLRAWIVARTVVDSDGKRLFADDDIESIGEKNAAIIERLQDVAIRLSGMGRDVEELEKNSGSSQSADSGTN